MAADRQRVMTVVWWRERVGGHLLWILVTLFAAQEVPYIQAVASLKLLWTRPRLQAQPPLQTWAKHTAPPAPSRQRRRRRPLQSAVLATTVQCKPVVAAMRARQTVAEALRLRTLVVAAHPEQVEELLHLCLGAVRVDLPIWEPVAELVSMLQVVVAVSLPLKVDIVVPVWAARRVSYVLVVPLSALGGWSLLWRWRAVKVVGVMGLYPSV